MEVYKALSDHFDKIEEALKNVIGKKITDLTDEDDNYYILRTLFNSLSVKNKDKFYRTFFKELIDVLAEDGETIHHRRVEQIYKMVEIISDKLEYIVSEFESNKHPEDDNLLIYKRPRLYGDEWNTDQLKFLTKIIPNSELKYVERSHHKIFLNFKFPKTYSVSEFIGKMKKSRERKKKLKSFEKVLEKTVALKRIQKFASRIGEGIIARRQFDSLVFY